MIDIYSDAPRAQKLGLRDILENAFIYGVVIAIMPAVVVIAAGAATVGFITDGLAAIKVKGRE